MRLRYCYFAISTFMRRLQARTDEGCSTVERTEAVLAGDELDDLEGAVPEVVDELWGCGNVSQSLRVI
jgi:hypothetical protein